MATVGVVAAGGAANADTTSTVAGIPGVCAGPLNPRIAVDAQGDQAAAWYCHQDSTGAMGVQFSSAPAGGSWSAAEVVIENAIGPAHGPQIAMNDDRALVATGSRGGSIAVFIDATGVHPALTIPPPYSAWNPALATNSSGDFVLAWSEPGASSGRVRATTGTFAAGFASPSTLLEDGQAGSLSAAVDGAGNAAVGWEGHIATTEVSGGTQSTWRTQSLGASALPAQVMVGGGQVTVVAASLAPNGFGGWVFECEVTQEPIGGSLGPMVDLGPCGDPGAIFVAMNDSGWGVIAINHMELATLEKAGTEQVVAYVVPPGEAPTSETVLGAPSESQVIPYSAVVDGSSVATVAWQEIDPSLGWVDLTASMDLSQLVSGSRGSAAPGEMASRTRAASLSADAVDQPAGVASTTSSSGVSHGTVANADAISLAVNPAGLLAAIWGRGTAFSKAILSPTVTGLSSRTAPTTGGTTVTVNGARYVKDSVVYFGDVPATTVTYVSATQLKAVAPAHAQGEVSVRVVAQGASAATPKSTFVYGPAPSISGLSPRGGDVAGGADVTVTGSNFVPGTTVRFGYTAATNVRFVSSDTIIVTAPKHAVGTVAVKATTLAGSSGATNDDLFAYGTPKISSFSPTSASTGTTVKLAGTSFLPGSAVSFGGLPSPSVTFVSGTQIKAVVPDGAPTGVITVTGPGGTAVSGTALKVTFSITGFTPTGGPPGTVIVVSGTGFTSTSTVQIGGVPASRTYVSPTQLRVTVPADAVSGQVTVSKPYKGTVASPEVFTVG
jgi:hypothetical protein